MAEYGEIRMWVTAADCAVSDPARVSGWGGQAIAVRLILAALGQAAMVSRSRVIEFGVRNLALQAGVSYRTAARVMRLLREEDDPLVDLVSLHRLWRADRYQLVIPRAYEAAARWRRRRAGRIEAIHPTFQVLGGVAALLYVALTSEEASGAALARTAALSESAVLAALKILAEHGLAEHGRRGWRRGPCSLERAAEACGAMREHEERQASYSDQRREWRTLIAMWMAAPAPRYRDESVPVRIDDILQYLEPPAWLVDDPGPPVAAPVG